MLAYSCSGFLNEDCSCKPWLTFEGDGVETADRKEWVGLAGGESYVILLNPPLRLAGVLIAMARGRRHNDSPSNG